MPRINKGYGFLALLERQCFRHHFKDISSKLSLMESLIRPTVLYGSEIWGPSLLESDWASAERVQTLLLRCIIRCKQSVPQHIILAEFGVRPFRLETVFRLVSFLHRIRSYADSRSGQDRYPYLAYCSSETIALSSPPGRARGWFAGVSDLFESVGIHIDRLPLFRYSLDAPGHLLPTRQKLNKIIRDDIYRQFIQTTWVNPQGGLRPKMAFYAEHFLELQDGLIVRPQYTFCHWMHTLRIPLGQFRVGSHRLRVETDHQIDRSDRICQLCQIQEVETEEHFIFRCPVYYEIRGRFQCLFRRSRDLTSFFRYPDQRCLALYMQEALRLRAHILQPPTRPDSTRQITSFFTVLPSGRGTKRQPDISTASDPRSVQARRTIPHTTRFQRHDQISSLTRRRTRSPRHQQRTTSSRQQRRARSKPPTSSSSSSSSGHHTILRFLHSASDVRRDGSTP